MDDERDPLIDEIAASLKAPVRVSPELDARVLARIRRPRPGPLARAWRWLAEPRAIAVSPLAAGGALAAALLLAALGIRRERAARPGRGAAPVADASPTAAARGAGDARLAGARREMGAGARVVHFVLIAPGASSVAIVGDFNDWSTTATPMHRASEGGAWSVSIPLRPGRYAYSFIVNGRQWMPDPLAPPAPHDDFGKPNSVVTVGGRAT
ncbi:MAG TPA: isoamylase early set domain-containing protein [Gemmatimonadaceae bacterium]